jgi:uncharacterized repeat protein (TIGR01451 family)
MSRRHISRVAALLAGLPAIAALVLLVGVGPAAATSCSGGLTPDFLLTQSITTGAGTAAYDLTVTNDGNCGATDVEVVVQLPSGSTFTGYNGVQRSWSCAADASMPNQVDCFLQSQLDQKSTQSSGASGSAEVVVNASAVSSGNQSNPPDVTDYAYVTDDLQTGLPGISGVSGPYDADDAVWGGAINPKTGGKVSTGITTFEPNQNNTVNVPSGVPGTVGLTEKVASSNCDPTAPPPVVATCLADIQLNAIVMQVFSSTAPPPPAYDEGAGIFAMSSCKGQTATPPCVYSIKGFSLNTNNPYYLITIRDSSGTLIWH